MKLWPILIPSKGRAGKIRDFYFQVPVILFVEPQEFSQYRLKHPTAQIKALPENNQGITYVRNFILSFAQELAQPQGWFWTLDDDMEGVYRSKFWKQGKYESVTLAEALGETQRLIYQGYQVGQISLQYLQYACLKDDEPDVNGAMDCCTAINLKASKGLIYRKEVELKEDRDFSLQILSRGYTNMRSNKYAIKVPENGSNAGGLKEKYELKTPEEKASRTMEKLWPGICKFYVKPNGRKDVKIKWSAFKKRFQKNESGSECP